MLLVRNSMFFPLFFSLKPTVINKENRNYKTYIFNEIRNRLKLQKTAFEEYGQVWKSLGPNGEQAPRARACSSRFYLDAVATI